MQSESDRTELPVYMCDLEASELNGAEVAGEFGLPDGCIDELRAVREAGAGRNGLVLDEKYTAFRCAQRFGVGRIGLKKRRINAQSCNQS
jgi:hypothetical protein